MPKYRPVRTPIEKMIRLKNLIMLLVEEGMDPNELNLRLENVPRPMINQALAELELEGRLELAEHTLNNPK